MTVYKNGVEVDPNDLYAPASLGVPLNEYVEHKDYPIERRIDGKFHIGQSYEKSPAVTLACKICGSDKFYVGQDSYYTAIKCVVCEWEIPIHTG